MISQDKFIELALEHQSTKKLSDILGWSEARIREKRRAIYKSTGVYLKLNKNAPTAYVYVTDKMMRSEVDLHNGVIIVGSDAHYSPNVDSTAHKAAVFLTKELKPDVFVMNGDSFDGQRISRFGRIGWEQHPTVKEELDCVQTKLEDIAQASLNTKLLHTWGNHDTRFNARLAQKVDEFEGVDGFTFEERFPRWKFSVSVMVNGNTMIKHRYHGGVHALWNNVIKSGTSIVTGHLHSLQCRPFTDYNGTRYAVDTGTLTDPYGEQFGYAEDNPRNHRSGFAVLTFFNGRLMPPDLCEVIDEEEGVCWFRGQQFSV